LWIFSVGFDIIFGMINHLLQILRTQEVLRPINQSNSTEIKDYIIASRQTVLKDRFIRENEEPKPIKILIQYEPVGLSWIQRIMRLFQ